MHDGVRPLVQITFDAWHEYEPGIGSSPPDDVIGNIPDEVKPGNPLEANGIGIPDEVRKGMPDDVRAEQRLAWHVPNAQSKSVQQFPVRQIFAQHFCPGLQVVSVIHANPDVGIGIPLVIP